MDHEQTKALVFNTCTFDGLPVTLAELVVAQSRHESDDYRSHVYLTDNNFFGYKRNTLSQWQQVGGTQSPEGDHYAHYETPEDSVHELTHWIFRRQREGKFPLDLKVIQTPLEYATALKNCGYYGDTLQNYTAGLQKYFSETS